MLAESLHLEKGYTSILVEPCKCELMKQVNTSTVHTHTEGHRQRDVLTDRLRIKTLQPKLVLTGFRPRQMFNGTTSIVGIPPPS